MSLNFVTLESELDLVTNDATAAIGEFGSKKTSCKRARNAGRDSLFAGREGTDTGCRELRVIENIVEFCTELQGLTLANLDALKNINVPVLDSRGAQCIAAR